MFSDKKTRQKAIVVICVSALIVAIVLLYAVSKGAFGQKSGDNSDSAISVFDSSNSSDSQETSHISDNNTAEGASKEGVSEAGAYKPESPALIGGSYENDVFEKSRSDISGNSLYEAEPARIGNSSASGNTLQSESDINALLKELMDYWASGNMDAVRELVHIERFETLTGLVTGTGCYYYGDKNAEGIAEGTGIAVYAKDQYYYGEWKNGIRSGEGSWFSFYPENDTGTTDEHMYTGSWENDLPNGHGQENYVYDLSKMDGVSYYEQNVIGDFHNGMYNGDMYVITQDKSGDTTEWYGTCEDGVWKSLAEKDKKNYAPVLYQGGNKDHYIWMPDSANKDYGVEGLISVMLAD